jgi:hypothetical protein
MTTDEYATEAFGFKVLLGGGAMTTFSSWLSSLDGTTVIGVTTFSSWLSSLDWTTVIGVTVMICGAILQIIGSLRARKADQREQEKHAIEMAVLRKKLEE